MSLPAQNDPPFDRAAWGRHALLTCAEMRRAEALSVAQGPQTYYDLMLIMGRAVAQAARARFAPQRVLVLCGAGNNGGDGYVAAQTLREAGWVVRVAALADPKTEDAKRAAQAWQGETLPLTLAALEGTDLIVDALFGTGLTRALDGPAEQIIAALVASKRPVISADFPSGVEGDGGRVPGVAPMARVTVTFFRKKRGQVLLPGRTHCGEIVVADEGMHEEVLDEVAPLTAENHTDLWLSLEPRPEAQTHKYDRGHALIFGGAVMTGASRLAARAAQRMGAGLVSLAAPRAAWEIYAKALESVIVPPVDDLAACQALIDDPKRNAVLIGPGLGREGDEAFKKKLILAVLASRKPTVLDADALTLFGTEPAALFEALHEACVLTPHEGEFARLFGRQIDPKADKISRAQQAASIAGCTVLLKGADTVIAQPDGYAVINGNAPPWLATGGAGDVLAGMILGLMTAGMPPFAAACAGAYRHGQSASWHGPGLIAEDLIDGIPRILGTAL